MNEMKPVKGERGRGLRKGNRKSPPEMHPVPSVQPHAENPPPRARPEKEEQHYGERYFRNLIESTKDLIAVLDRDLVIRYLSPSVERISGYTVEEALGRGALEFFHPKDLNAVVGEIARELEEKGVAENIQFRWRHKDGSYRWHEATVFDLLEDPDVRGIVVNARDITDRKRAELALQESEERYRRLVETSPDAIVLTDMTGKILMINRAGTALLGYDDPGEITGRNVLEFITPEDRARAIESMRTRPPGGGARREEYVLVRRGGQRMWAEISASLLRNAEGRPAGFIAITRDITEHKRARLGLERLNRCFLSLGHNSMENIANIVTTGADILEARFAHYGRVEKGKHYLFSTLEAEKGFALQEKPERHLVFRLLRRGHDGPVLKEDVEAEGLALDPEATARRCGEILSYCIKLKGEPVGDLCFFFEEKGRFTPADMDILIMLGRAIAIEEDRWLHEQGLRDFIDVASHELRHPLALLSGFSELLHEHGGEMEEKLREEALSAIRLSTERLTNVAEGLVKASLLERQLFTIERREVDLPVLAEGAVMEMRARFPKRDFKVSYPPRMPRLPVDPARIHDVLIILLENAVRYSPEGCDVEVLLESETDGVLVSVLDRGRGVEERNRSRIFERFYQEEKAQYHSQGLGLGLYLARQIVEGHGGRIWHEPRPGGGSIFRFFLPFP